MGIRADAGRLCGEVLEESSLPDVNLKDYSHWKGEGKFKDEQRWLALGRAHFQMFEESCRLIGLTLPLNAIVEWGCGGGMNAVHFAQQCRRFYGVEIAEASLRESARVLQEIQFEGFQAVLVAAQLPEQAIEAIHEPCDFFLCTYVFQVFPGKSYGLRITQIAHRLLKSGGAALIQIRYDDGSLDGAPKRRNYFRNVVHFTSYAINEYWLLAEQAGFVPEHVYLVPTPKRYPHTDSALAYFLLRRP